MARLLGPLHSDDAAGMLAGSMVYTSYLGHPYVKRHAPEIHQPGTPAQREIWSRFKAALAAWRALPPEERAKWAKRAVRLHLTGYNAFLRAHMHR